MIPKVIHYIWLGGPVPDDAQERVNQWQRIMPDYQFVLWNEDNWDLSQNEFAKYNYEKKVYAYVSDVIRLDVLNRYGGFYLDTDMIVKKSLNIVRNANLVLGFMYDNALSTSLMGAVAHNDFIQSGLNFYRGLNGKEVELETIPNNNNKIITDMFKEIHPEFNLNNQLQYFNGEIVVYPKEYFTYPSFNSAENIAQHLFDKTWDQNFTTVAKTKLILRKVIGEVAFGKISSFRGKRRYR